MAFAGKRRAFGKLMPFEFLTIKDQPTSRHIIMDHQPTLIRNFDSVLSPPLDSDPSLKLTAKHLKMDGWKTMCLSFWGQFGPIFRGELAVSFREGSKRSSWMECLVEKKVFVYLPKKLTWNLKIITVPIGKSSSTPEFL